MNVSSPERIPTGALDSRPLLIVCRTEQGLAGLPGLCGHRPVIVASDDPRVQLAAGRQPGVCQTSYIEQSVSFYSVAPAARETVEKIDEWLAGFTNQCPDLSEEILRWGCTVEGGLTSQRVQDALLLIDSYQNLLDRIQPASIVLSSSAASSWDDLVLAQIAVRRGIPFRHHAPTRLRRLVQAAVTWLRPYALLTYRLLHLLRRGGGRPTPGPAPLADADGRIVFVLCNRAPNHFENIKSVMLELVHQGASCLIVRWHATERMSLRDTPGETDSGTVPSHPLERWVGLRDVGRALLLSRRLRLRIMAAKDHDAPWQRLVYRGVPLVPLLVDSLRHFLIAELPSRIIFLRALHGAFSAARPMAVKPWGAPEGFEYRAISRLWPGAKRPLIFQYWLGVGMSWPYADPRQHLDLFLAKDAGESAQVARDYCRDPAKIEIVGQIRLAGHRQFAEVTPQAVSRQHLGLLDLPGALYIGFDPNCALRGYQSAREQAEITQALLTAAGLAKNLVLIVKPHPAYPIDHLAPLFAAANNPRVVVLTRGAPLTHFLNSLDIMVSKYSTLLLEAALMRRISVAVIPDGDTRFQVFGQLAPVFTDLATLADRLCQLADDHRERADWLAERLRQQEDYLIRYYFPPTNEVPAARAAAAIIAHADRHHSYRRDLSTPSIVRYVYS